MRRLATLASFAAALAAATPAFADDEDAAIVLGVIGVSGVFGGDIALTALAADAAVNNQNQSQATMIFQTAFVAPQAVLGHVPLIIGVTEYDGDEDDLIAGLLGMFGGAWGNTLLIYSSWSLSEGAETPGTRLGLSVLTGTNLMLTVGALASFTRGGSKAPVAPSWLAGPELVMGATGTAFGIYKAVDDNTKLPGWVTLSVWSSAIFAHGLVSSIVLLDGGEGDEIPVGSAEPRGAFGMARVFVAPTVLPGDQGLAYGAAAAGIF